MPDAPALPALAAALEEGEVVVWAGRPVRLPEPERLLLYSAVALPALALAAMGGAAALNHGVPLVAVTTAGVALGVSAVAGLFGRARRQMQTRYAVTDRRPLVVQPSGKVEEVPSWTVAQRRKDVRYTGRGTITFGQDAQHAFRHVDDVRAADAALAALPSARALDPAALGRTVGRADASNVPERILNTLAGVLEDGETIRWWGHPDEAALKGSHQGYRARHSLRGSNTALAIAMGLMGLQLALLGWTLYDGEIDRFSWGGMLTPLILLVGALLSRRRMRQRLYVITDRRALVVTPQKAAGYRVRSVSPGDLAARKLVKGLNGIPSIRFDGGSGAPTSLDADAFVGPEPVALVDALLEQLARTPAPMPGLPLPDARPDGDAPARSTSKTRV